MNQFGNRGFGNYGARAGLGPAVFILLVINVGMFLLQFLVAGFSGRDPIGAWLSFIPYFAIQEFQIWRFVTYMFLHGDFMHIAFNMLGLFIFGSRLEGHWGTRTFAWYYMVSGIGGGLLYGLLSLAGTSALIPMVGASGAVYGLLLAFGMAFPEAKLFIMFVIPVPARIAVILFGVVSLLGIGGANVAHMAHLGGMVTGLIFLWYFTGGRISQIPRLPGGRRPSRSAGTYAERGADGMPRSRAAQRGGLQGLVDAFYRWRTKQRMNVVDGKRGQRPGNGSAGSGAPQTRVDEILEKISREGLKSLTEEEQKILRQASRKD